jgi:hypothetical protein
VSAEPIYSPEDELLDAGPGEHELDDPALSADSWAYLEPSAEELAPNTRLTAVPLTQVQMRSISWLERPLWQRHVSRRARRPDHERRRQRALCLL